MSIAFRQESPPDDPSLRFPSLTALREAHVDLLGKRRETESMPELLSEMEELVRRGRATGALLDAESDRMVAQSLLDYWAALLYRLDRRTVDATLDEFDPSLAPTLEDCPYVGLDPFREENHARFFGRHELIGQMIERLDDRLLIVVGPSGSGKSSLVQGGLLPRLKAGALAGSERWQYLRPIVPGSEPFRNLAAAVLPPGTEPERIGELAARLAEDPEHLSRLADGDQPWVIVIDQFEELFTLCDNEAARQAFAWSLRSLVDAESPPHLVLLTLRSDYESYMTRLTALQPLYQSRQVRVPPLIASELREAIEKPAELVGLKLEEGLVEALIHDLLGDPAGLPLLQFTLLKLWEHRSFNRVTRRAYEELGSGRSALANSAQKFFDEELSSAEQVTARRILLRMVQLSENLEVTSNRVRREALYRIEDPERVKRVLDKLVEAHLVRLTEGETPADIQVEVAHEALIRNWPTLAEWLEDERAQLLIRRRWEMQAAEWVRFGLGESGLLGEAQLSEVERWLKSADATRLGYSEALPQLVEASRTALDARRAKEEAARQHELEQARQLAEAEGLRAEAERLGAEEKQRRLDEKTRSARRLRWLTIGLAITLIATLLLAWGLLVKEWERRNLAEREAKRLQKENDIAKNYNIRNKEDALLALRIERQRREEALQRWRAAEAVRKVSEERSNELDQKIRDLQAELDKSALNDQRLKIAELTREDYRARLGEASRENEELKTSLASERAGKEQLQEEIDSLKKKISRLEQTSPKDNGAGPDPVTPVRSLSMGMNVGSASGTVGRLCCYVRSSTGGPQIYLLSLASVLRGQTGTSILSLSSPVATLHKVGRYGAIAKPLPGISLDFQIPALGKIKGVENDVYVGDPVTLIRSGGENVPGKVVELKKLGGIVGAVIDIPFIPGDAGAPVLAEDRELIGMVTSPGNTGTYVVHIKQVLNDLGVDLVDENGRPLR